MMLVQIKSSIFNASDIMAVECGENDDGKHVIEVWMGRQCNEMEWLEVEFNTAKERDEALLLAIKAWREAQ